jgi:hypothetical protein
MSTFFVDGPAAGKRLDLRRAPLYLRVVIDADGGVDALDLLDDTPDPGEAIYVYRMSANLGSGIACTRGKGCRPFNMSEYKLHGQQPPDDVARDFEKWRGWTAAQFEQEQRIDPL